MPKSKKKLSVHELRTARLGFDQGQIDKRTRVGRLAVQAMSKRGRKSAEEQAALAAVGYPGY